MPCVVDAVCRLGGLSAERGIGEDVDSLQSIGRRQNVSDLIEGRVLAHVLIADLRSARGRGGRIRGALAVLGHGHWPAERILVRVMDARLGADALTSDASRDLATPDFHVPSQ